jgi:uncharacterized membrane protein YgcG
MKRLLIALLLFAVPLSAQRTKPLNARIDSLFPSQPTGYLTDVAHVVTNGPAVNAEYQRIRDSLKLSLVAVTLPTIRDYQPYEVAMEIGRKWLVALKNDTLGAATRNTGAVVLLVMDTHKCFIATATGTEGYITDATAGELCAAQRPLFRSARYGDGLIGIAQGIEAKARADLAAAARPKRPSKPADYSFLWWLGALAVVAVGVIAWFVRQARLVEEERIREESRELARRQERTRQEEALRQRLQREADERERQRWAALTPEQRAAELEERERRRREAEAAAAVAAAARAKQEEEDRVRRASSSSYSSYDSGSSSSSSSSSDSGSSWSSGGSDSFSGGGGGDSW